jgi:hypothetical protein
MSPTLIGVGAAAMETPAMALMAMNGAIPGFMAPL